MISTHWFDEQQNVMDEELYIYYLDISLSDPESEGGLSGPMGSDFEVVDECEEETWKCMSATWKWKEYEGDLKV